MATAAEIRDRALKKMGILSSSQSVSASVAADLDAAYSELYAEHEMLLLADWHQDDVPTEYVESLALLTAERRLDDYSVPNDRYTRIKSAAAGAELRIRELRSSAIYDQQPGDYF